MRLTTSTLGGESAAVAGAAMVEVRGLRKNYGKLAAVQDVSFSIAAGSIFGLLGPNGAGKTSIIEMIEGLRIPDGGSVRVAGLDPVREARQVKQLIGAQLQTTSLNDKIRVGEVLDLFATFYAQPMKMGELLALAGLEHKKDTYFQYLSGGEKQRVALALALVGNPQVLFLDEPTTGLDAQIRRELHELILRIKQQGKTVLLSTHYLEEAERLCDEVGILSEGRLHAVGAPRELIRQCSTGESIEFTLREPVDCGVFRAMEGVSSCTSQADRRYRAEGRKAGQMLAAIAVYAYQTGNEILEARVAHSTLEEVYLQLTGRRISE